MKRAAKLLIGFAVTAVCLILAFRRIPLDQVWTAATAIAPRTLLAGFLFGSSATFLRAVRWRILLAARAPVDLRLAFEVNSAGQLGNAALPARLGDLYRATNLGSAGLRSGFTFATIFVERILDTGFLVMVASLILVGSVGAAPWLSRAARILSVAAAGGLLTTLILPLLESKLETIATTFLPENLHTQAVDFLNLFLDGLRSFRHAGRIASFLSLTAIIWTLDFLGVTVLGSGLDLHFSIATAALLISALALSSAVPAAPGNLGVYQLVVISVLGTVGIAREQALSFALVLQTASAATLTTWGLLSFWSLSSRNQKSVAPLASILTSEPEAIQARPLSTP